MLASSQLFYEVAILIVYYLILKQKLGPNMSQGWKCIWTGLVLTRNVSGPEMSQGRKCLRAGLVSGPDLSQGSRPEMSRAGSVSRPEVSKILGPEVSCGRKCPKV
jgi:hypothetical protein